MNKLIYAMHESCPLDILPLGWIVYVEELGSGSAPHPGLALTDRVRKPIIRGQYLFGNPGQCLPQPDELEGFVGRFISMVANTPACHHWLPGNEPNVAIEGHLSPEYVAKVYDKLRLLVHGLPGHEKDEVLLPAVGPWNATLGYGWIEYFERMIAACDDIDAFALHTYARSASPDEITSDARMGDPYQQYHSSFRTYWDWMEAIPLKYRNRSVYITEFDENDAWANRNTRIIQAAYEEIDHWNRVPGNQQIKCLALYRWPKRDKYFIEGLDNVIIDFLFAQEHDYRWKEPTNMALSNPTFNLPYITVPGHDNCRVAEGWTAWTKPHQPIDVDLGEEGSCSFPEYKPITMVDDPNRILEGDAAQCFFLTSKRMNAGVYQSVPVGTDNIVTFTAHVHTWCSDSGDYYTADGEMYARVLIDPLGGTDIEADGVIKSGWHRCRAEYDEIEVVAAAEANSVTVFIQFWNKWKMTHNDAYVGNTSLIVEGGVPPEPPEPPKPPSGDLIEELLSIAVDQEELALRIRVVLAQLGTSEPAVFQHIAAAQAELDAALQLRGGG